MRRRRSRGQAMMEMALAAPIIMLLCLGGTDMSQAYLYSLDSAGAARAGMKAAVIEDDIGDSIRAEPNTLINATTDWGDENPNGGSDGNWSCSSPLSTLCGDKYGCLTSGANSPFVKYPSQRACFAVRSCVLAGSGSYTCGSYNAWQTTLPAANAGEGIQVKVVIAYKPYTPLIANLAGSSGTFYLTSTVTGIQLY